MQQIKVPDINSVADGGQLLFANSGEVVLIGVQAGGLSIAPPTWMRAHYLQAFAMCGKFIEQCSMKQAEDYAKLLQQATGKH
jgi:hypothetical protein